MINRVTKQVDEGILDLLQNPFIQFSLTTGNCQVDLLSFFQSLFHLFLAYHFFGLYFCLLLYLFSHPMG